MIEWINAVLPIIMAYGAHSYIIIKIIEAIGLVSTAIHPQLGRFFSQLLKMEIEIIKRGKIAFIGIPIAITGQMLLGFFIGRFLFGF